MEVLYYITGFCLLLSLLKSRTKTKQAFKIFIKKTLHIIPSFTYMLIFVSVILFFTDDQAMVSYFNNSDKFVNLAIATLIGSISVMPGFIVFPLCSILLKKGVSYMVLSGLSTTLMMVGIVTFPVEKKYFGTGITVIRNTISLLIAVIIALITGFFFGEL